MSTAPQNSSENQEIDLSQISKKIGNLFEGISNTIFRGILFIKKHIIVVGLLFIVGAVLGVYLDKTQKIYDNQLFVSPNFGTVDYLYTKINLINSKVNENDTVFLKEIIGIKEPSKLGEITVEPVTDVYKFINYNEKNFEFIKLLAEDGDIKKLVNENLTSKNYPYHLIRFSTSKATSNENTIAPLLAFLNKSDYYKKIQYEYLNNLKIKMVQNDTIISQINGVLNSFSSAVNGFQRNDKLIYYNNENTQLNDVIKTKNDILIEQGLNRIELVNYEAIIKEISATINILNTRTLNGKMKIVLPLLFISIYLLIRFFIAFYKKQMSKL